MYKYHKQNIRNDLIDKKFLSFVYFWYEYNGCHGLYYKRRNIHKLFINNIVLIGQSIVV